MKIYDNIYSSYSRYLLYNINNDVFDCINVKLELAWVTGHK